MNAAKLYSSYITKERLQRIHNVFSIQFTIKDFNLKRTICFIVEVGHSKHFDFVVEQCLDPIQVLL